MNGEGLVYLLNQAGIALAQANQSISELSAGVERLSASEEGLTVDLASARAEIEYLAEQEPYTIKVVWDQDGEGQAFGKPSRVELITLDGAPHPTLRLLDYSCEEGDENFSVNYTVVRASRGDEIPESLSSSGA